jgi:hypothetical protein
VKEIISKIGFSGATLAVDEKVRDVFRDAYIIEYFDDKLITNYPVFFHSGLFTVR